MQRVVMYGRAGQVYCSDCGALFAPRKGARPVNGVLAVFCPNPACNRGSWFVTEPDRDHYVPVEVDLTDLRCSTK